MKEDLYTVLGIDRKANASEIKKAYRQKAKEHHPDKGGDADEFKKISYAYEVLSTPNKKQIYDTRGHDGLNGGQPQPQRHSFHDMFQQMEMQRQQQEQEAQANVVATLVISIHDVYNGASKSVAYNRFITCEPCHGLGGTNPQSCMDCNGTGKTARVTRTQHGYMQEIMSCHTCMGGGTVYDNKCKHCDGHGKTIKRHQEAINISPSTMHGEILTFHGLGHSLNGTRYGNLHIRIEIANSDDFQILQDYGLLSVVKLPYEVMVLGGKAEFITIDKTKIKFSVPKLSNIGNKVKISGKGLKNKNNNSIRGDQFIILDILIPESVSDEEIKILEKLKKLKE